MAGIVVNGERHGISRACPCTPMPSTSCAAAGSPAARRAAPRASAAPARSWSPGPAPDGSDATEWTAINSCLVPAAALDGQEVVTAEGLGSPDALHPVQHEMAVRGGSQCGYCTPGFVCSMAAEYYRARTGRPTDGLGHADRRARPERLRPARHERQPVPLHRLPADPRRRLRARRPGRGRRLRRPPRRRPPPAPAGHPDRRRTGEFVRPADLAEALRLLARPCRTPPSSPARTDWGVEVNLRGAPAPRSSSPSTGCPSCAASRSTDDEVEIGAALTLTEIERRLDGRVPLLDQLFPQFASPADPQRRHARRQPRHRLADRRRAAGPARPGGRPRPGVARRRARGPAGRLLHRLPRSRSGSPAS